MKKIFYTYLLAVVALTFSALSSATYYYNNVKYSDIYVFGDSLSDQGNLAATSPNFQFLSGEPYNDGRFTNGLTAVEVLATNLGHTLTPSFYFLGQESGNNYAVAGARAATDQPIDLNSQVKAYLGLNNSSASSDILYIVMIGGNDIRLARDTESNRESRKIIRDAIANTQDNIELLIAAGARNFLVVNAPDISALPETDLVVAKTGITSLLSASKAYSKSYNKQLKRAVSKLRKRNRDVRIASFDLFSFFNSVIRSSRQLGFSNNMDACYSTFTQAFTPQCNNGDDIGEFVFFDEIHPTEFVHQFAGSWMLSALARYNYTYNYYYGYRSSSSDDDDDDDND